MQFLISLLLAMPIFGQLLRLPLVDRMGLMPSDLLIVLILGGAFLQFLQGKSYKIPRSILYSGLIFALWALWTLLFNVWDLSLSRGELFTGFAYYGRHLLYLLLWPVLWVEIRKKPEFYQKYLLIMVLIVAILGFVQLKFFPSFKDLRMNELGWDPHEGRLLSTWFDPNYVGIYFGVGATLALSQFFDDQKYRYYYLGMAVFLLLALGLTYSRSAYLGSFIMLGILAFFKERKLLLIGGMAVLLLVAGVPRARERVLDAVESAQALFTQTTKTMDPTSRLRVQSWQVGWKFFQEKPLTGIGFNNLKTLQKREWTFMTNSHAASGIDASLLTLLATTGIIGTVLALLTWFFILKTHWHAYFQQKNTWSLAVLAIFAGLVVHSCFVNTFFFTLFLPSLWAITVLDNNRHKVDTK